MMKNNCVFGKSKNKISKITLKNFHLSQNLVQKMIDILYGKFIFINHINTINKIL